MGSSDSSSSSSSVSKELSCASSSFINNSFTSYYCDPSIFEGGDTISCLSPHHNQCLATLKTPNHHHITFLAVQNNLIYAASGNEINVFDLTTLSLMKDHALSFDSRDVSSGGFIKSIAFYDNNKILTAHQDSKIRVWKRHRLVTKLPTFQDRLCHFVRAKNYVQVRRHKKKLWIQHSDAVSGLALHNGLIYSVSWDKSLKIWRASDFKCLESIRAHEDAINAVSVSDRGVVYTGSADGKIRVWKRDDKVGQHCMVETLEGHGSTVNALALSRDGRVLFSGGCDGDVVVWERDIDHDRMVESAILGGHYGPVLCLIRLDNDHDQDLFVSGSADRTVRIWGRGHNGLFYCLAILEGHNKPVRSLTVVPPEKGSDGVVSVCSGSLDGEIKIWQVIVSKLMNK